MSKKPVYQPVQKIIDDLFEFESFIAMNERNIRSYYKRRLDRLEIIFQKLSILKTNPDFQLVLEDLEELIQDIKYS